MKNNTPNVRQTINSKNVGMKIVKNAFQFENRCATATPATLITNVQTEIMIAIRNEIVEIPIITFEVT